VSMPIRGRIAPIFTSLDLYLDRRMDLHCMVSDLLERQASACDISIQRRTSQNTVFMIEFGNSTGTKYSTTD
jgi:hypothetical protein